jgi:Tfp pilus assembly protein PilP
MKLTTGILLLGMATGAAWAQNPDVIQDTRSTLQNFQKKQVIDQNAALSASGQSSAPTVSTSSHSASTSASSSSTAAKPAAKNSSNTSATAPAKPKAAAKSSKPEVVTVSDVPTGKAATRKSSKKAAPVTAKTAAPAPEPAKAAAPQTAADEKKSDEPKKEETPTYTANGRRDPFISPVVNRSMLGSGCSTGKRCLAIDQIILQGVVKSETGMIAVVVNALNKAYFLHENDPVFNGYVVKITGDSIIFKETVQDKLGKPFEREVTKKISTPAV